MLVTCQQTSQSSCMLCILTITFQRHSKACSEHLHHLTLAHKSTRTFAKTMVGSVQQYVVHARQARVNLCCQYGFPKRPDANAQKQRVQSHAWWLLVLRQAQHGPAAWRQSKRAVPQKHAPQSLHGASARISPKFTNKKSILSVPDARACPCTRQCRAARGAPAPSPSGHRLGRRANRRVAGARRLLRVLRGRGGAGHAGAAHRRLHARAHPLERHPTTLPQAVHAWLSMSHFMQGKGCDTMQDKARVFAWLRPCHIRCTTCQLLCRRQ